jgi:phage shock protein C
MTEEHRYCARCGKPANDNQYQWTQPPPQPPRRLERNMYRKRIAGVCAGFADYFGMDPAVMRLIWVAVAIFTGISLVAYPICWLVMPRSDERAFAPSAYQQG